MDELVGVGRLRMVSLGGPLAVRVSSAAGGGTTTRADEGKIE